MLRRIIFPHSLILTFLMFALIWILDVIRINLHFLNPFNESIRDYQITDIVYSRLRDKRIAVDNRIVMVNTGQPSRDTLAMLVNRIREAGAKVIAIDIMLEERKNPVTDSILLTSLTSMENVVLAMEIDGVNDETGIFSIQKSCNPYFCDNVYSGFINFITNDTSTVRIFSPKEMTTTGECLSFPVQAARLYDQEAADRLFKRGNKVEEIYYFGNEDQFVQCEQTDILDTSRNLQGIIKDKIVLIGFLPIDSWDKPMRDRHYTPLNARYTGRNTPDMYGIVIHANIIRMILDNTYVVEPSWGLNLLLTFLICYFNIHLYYQIFRRVSVPYHFVTRFLQIGETVILFFLVALLFHFYRIKIDAGYWITALLLTFDAVKFYDNGIKKRIPLFNKIPYELPLSVKKKKTQPEKNSAEKSSDEPPVVEKPDNKSSEK
ncbi:MAG: CHASE2 domain-containing protein [Chitinophagales bacterium]|nr:CHASE2 domain-containing protein [Chitinophagales bacterium]